MKSVASAPGKIILFGEHFVVYGTKAILCAINKRITATSQLLDEKKIRVMSDLGNAELDLDKSFDLNLVSPRFMKPFFYIAKKTLKEFDESSGVEIVLESEIPAGIGLGSSSAACVAVTASVLGLFDKKPKKQILSKSIESERTIFEEISGADTSVSVFGGLMSYSKNGFEKIEAKNNFSLIIANSNQTHSTTEVVSMVREFKNENERIFFEMCQQENKILDDALVALKKNNLTRLGSLMSKNQELLKRINVSTEKLDLLINEASKTSYGAKITGAGGGGCIISLVDQSNMSSTLENLKRNSDCFVAKIDFDGVRYL